MKLKMPELGLRIRRLDANGQTISDRREPAHSWTRNGWNMLFALMTGAVGDNSGLFGAGYMSGKNTAGAIVSSNDHSVNRTDRNTIYGFLNNASAGSFVHPARGGLIVGSGNTAFTIDDHALDTVIGSGTDAGELWYPINGTHRQPVYDAGSDTWSATMERSFLNDSGGNVTVREAGINWYGAYFTSHTAGRETILVARDVLETEEVIAHSETFVINYDFVFSFAAMGTDGWNRNAFTWMLSTMSDSVSTGEDLFQDGVFTGKDTTGTIHRSVSGVPYGLNNMNISVGSGTTAFSEDHHTLATSIVDGSSAGQLSYGTTSTSVEYAAKTWKATISQVFTNNSGGDITINEFGLLKYNIRIFGSPLITLMMLRKVLAAPETVVNTDTFTLNIEISMDFSGID